MSPAAHEGSYDCPDDVFCVEINYIWLLRLKQNLLLCLNFVDFTNTGLFNELNKLLNDVIFLITFEMFCMLVIPLGGFIFTYAVFCQDGDNFPYLAFPFWFSTLVTLFLFGTTIWATVMLSRLKQTSTIISMANDEIRHRSSAAAASAVLNRRTTQPPLNASTSRRSTFWQTEMNRWENREQNMDRGRVQSVCYIETPDDCNLRDTYGRSAAQFNNYGSGDVDFEVRLLRPASTSQMLRGIRRGRSRWTSQVATTNADTDSSLSDDEEVSRTIPESVPTVPKAHSFACCFLVYMIMTSANLLAVSVLLMPHLVSELDTMEQLTSRLRVACNLLTLTSVVAKRAIYIPAIPIKWLK
ncbi:uncharacterized protein LOC142340150 isoform X2 [Convolutriloba macropyga]|uniref:uncharacterized protein LOC142340150 isoform X2 n=1 Tax=Convolutriloba macropyga TaxID=536237 RepID=UPI003F51FF7F